MNSHSPDIEKWARDKLNELLGKTLFYGPDRLQAAFGVPRDHSDKEAKEALIQAYLQDDRFAGTILRWERDEREIYVIRPNGSDIIKHPK